MKTEEKKKPVALMPKPIKEEKVETREIVIEQPIITKLEGEKVKPWNRQQLDLIKRTIAIGATDDELMMFRWISHRTQLDPFMRQIYFVKRWDSREGKEKGAIQVGIDGFRVIAERTGAYAGNDDVVFEGELEKEYEKKKYVAPAKATAKVYKIVQGIRSEFAATARWDEYYPGDKQGFMWRNKPAIMLGKCAEALALRKAFPAVLSGLYVEGELDRAGVAPQGPQGAVEDAFGKAKRLIGTVTDWAVLEDYAKKIEGSKLYSAEQKKTLKEAIEIKMVELKPKDEKHAEKKDEKEAI